MEGALEGALVSAVVPVSTPPDMEGFFNALTLCHLHLQELVPCNTQASVAD